MIAMGLICKPRLVIADEPTTSLDVTVQAQIVELVKSIRNELGTSILWISHDLGVVAGNRGPRHRSCTRAFIIVEEAPVDELYANPLHPYTQGLLRSLPGADGEDRARLRSIGGMPPYMNRMPRGCPFAPRCVLAKKECREANPPVAAAPSARTEGHRVACWVAAKGETAGWEDR